MRKDIPTQRMNALAAVITSVSAVVTPVLWTISQHR